MSVAVAFLMAVAVGLAAHAHWLVLAFVVVACQVATVAWWHGAFRAPGAVGGSALALAAGVSAVVLGHLGEDADPIASLTGLLGAATVALLVHQLFRRDRSQVVASMSSTSALLLLALLVALYVPAASAREGPAVVAVVAVAAAAAYALDLAPLPRVAALTAALGVGALIGLAAAAVSGVDFLAAIMTGLAAAAVSHLTTRGLLGGSQPPAWLLGTLPISVAAPVAYVAARVIGG